MTIHLRKLALTLWLTSALFLQFSVSHAKEQVQSKPIKLRTIHMPYIASSPLLIAEEEGYFTDQGLHIEYVRMPDAVVGLPALIKGDIDVIPDVIYPSYLNAIARGAKIRIVADRGYLASTGCPSPAIMVRRTLVEEEKLSRVSQLKGKRVAMTQGSSVLGYLMEKVLSQDNLTLSDIETVFLQMPARLDAFARGSIDVTLGSEPWVTQILQAGHAVIWKPVNQIVPNFQWAFLIYGPTLLENNPEAGKRLMVAYLKGVRQYNQGKTKRNLEIIAKHTGLDQELLQKCCWPTFHKDGQINIDSILDFQSWALKKGLLDKMVSPNQFWDPSYIEYANEVVNKSTK